ncbi:hypothetical protein [Burkholderia vietnamiensis]|uniref:hypothetical protein n=1 Tax=Burkholderia vietnamiensis TaxID=60552 RepID=UPI00158ADC07|nr:hypothetical protein [Burkholderia vietnamiensis]
MKLSTFLLVLMSLLIGEIALGIFCWITGGLNGRIAFYTGCVPLAIAVGGGFAFGRIDGVNKA